MSALDGLQLDLLTAIVRLEQIRDECLLPDGSLTSFGEYLFKYRILECDLPRLRVHLTPETLAWEETMKKEIS